MHEMALAQGILDIALANAAGGRVVKIKLLVGAMTAVEPQALCFCFSALSQDTAAAGAALEIETVPLVARCGQCGRQFTVENYRFLCPVCGAADVAVVSGRELKVAYLEVE